MGFVARPRGGRGLQGQADGGAAAQAAVLQTHAYRAELWIVVSGIATCVVEGRTIVAHPGDCVEIGLGVAHRISNVDDEDLVIIEVQRGSYTGEDDIVRLEDDYGRVASQH